jgi:Kef-type K+ transport system membrane component KefB
MFISARPTAISVAVLCFFVLSFVGIFYELSPFTCCERALIGAAVAYIATSIAVKILNAVITSAIIDRYTNKQKED